MSILSFEFIGFLIAVVALNYLLPHRARWVLLLVASLGFYALGGLAGLAYLLVAAALTWAGALWVRGRRGRLVLVVLPCLLALVFIKYCGAVMEKLSIPLIVPLGLSYFTFQSVGYVADVYWGKAEPERNPLKYLLFISFFPQMTQGPISPYGQLAPQLESPARFELDVFTGGFQLLMWGYFKKLVIADRLAPVTASIAVGGDQPGWLIVLGVILYAIRLYADFSGGMDIIRGAARLLGIDMVENFTRPFFARSVAEYWRRWHISLGVWFRTYVFYPITTSAFGLACAKWGRRVLGKKVGRALPGAIATFIIFLLIGVWHTANWNAVLYGVYFGVIMAGAMLLDPAFTRLKKALHVRDRSLGYAAFCLVRTWLLILPAQYFAMTFSPAAALGLFAGSFQSWSFQGFSGIMTGLLAPLEWGIAGAACAVLLAVDVLCERGVRVGERLAKGTLFLRWPLLMLLIVAVLVFGCYGEGYDAAAFLYTQF